jgi:hypothetical protein
MKFAIIGGGITGLWLLNALKKKGHECILFEKNPNGVNQTNGSQGVIHIGLKYKDSIPALTNRLEGIAEDWDDIFSGNGNIDLSKTVVSSAVQYYFSENEKIDCSYFKRNTDKKLRQLSREEFPAFLQNPAYTGEVFEAKEIVIEPYSLIQNLTEGNENCIYYEEVTKDNLVLHDNEIVYIQRSNGEQVKADYYVFAAGEGNGELCEAFQTATFHPMQLRPLQQVIVAMVDAANKAYPTPPKVSIPNPQSPISEFFGVCFGENPNHPSLIISSHYDDQGNLYWNIGGKIASEGATFTKTEQKMTAFSQLHRIFHWVDWSEAKVDSYFINRAEPYLESGTLPENSFVQRKGNAILTFPIKLALVPELTDTFFDTI